MCRKAALYVVAVTLFMWCVSVPQAARAATLTVGQKSAACPKPLYSTIQSAVTAASSGDTIHVCAGTYPEQVLITKSLNLSGDNGALIEPVNVAGNSTSFTSGQSIAAIVLVQGTTNVTIKNVIVDGSGNGISECSPDLVGIF